MIYASPRLRPGLIYVVDSNDRVRIQESAKELRSILQEESLRDAAVLVFCNKQDLPGSPLSFLVSLSDAATVPEVADALGMQQIRQKDWHVQASVATNGDGLIEGLDWLSKTVTSRV